MYSFCKMFTNVPVENPQQKSASQKSVKWTMQHQYIHCRWFQKFRCESRQWVDIHQIVKKKRKKEKEEKEKVKVSIIKNAYKGCFFFILLGYFQSKSQCTVDLEHVSFNHVSDEVFHNHFIPHAGAKVMLILACISLYQN